jgi:hypothetical protein
MASLDDISDMIRYFEHSGGARVASVTLQMKWTNLKYNTMGFFN